MRQGARQKKKIAKKAGAPEPRNERSIRVAALHKRQGACPACGASGTGIIGEAVLRLHHGVGEGKGRVRCVAVACVNDTCRLVTLNPIGLPIIWSLLGDEVLWTG